MRELKLTGRVSSMGDSEGWGRQLLLTVYSSGVRAHTSITELHMVRPAAVGRRPRPKNVDSNETTSMPSINGYSLHCAYNV